MDQLLVLGDRGIERHDPLVAFSVAGFGGRRVRLFHSLLLHVGKSGSLGLEILGRGIVEDSEVGRLVRQHGATAVVAGDVKAAAIGRLYAVGELLLWFGGGANRGRGGVRFASRLHGRLGGGWSNGASLHRSMLAGLLPGRDLVRAAHLRQQVVGDQGLFLRKRVRPVSHPQDGGSVTVGGMPKHLRQVLFIECRHFLVRGSLLRGVLELLHLLRRQGGRQVLPGRVRDVRDRRALGGRLSGLELVPAALQEVIARLMGELDGGLDQKAGVRVHAAIVGSRLAGCVDSRRGALLVPHQAGRAAEAAP